MAAMQSPRKLPSPPRYAQVADELARRIRCGIYPAGTCLPPEHRLCELFEVSRFTVRQALSRLGEMGLAAPEHGVGTRVASVDKSGRFQLALGSVPEIQAFTSTTRLQILRQEFVKATEADVTLPRIEPADRWLLIEGLRFMRGCPLPIALTQIHVSPRFAGIAERIGKRSGPVFALIEEMYGEQVATVRQQISAVAVPARMMVHLRLKRGAPVLRIVRQYMSITNETLQVSSSVSVSDRFVYSADIITR
jgi:GntR family transcriptional regulator